MKSLLQSPDYGLEPPAFWMMFVWGIVAAVVVYGGQHYLNLIPALSCLLVGVMMWQEQRWAIWIGLALYLWSFVSKAYMLFFAFQWSHIFYSVFSGYLAYKCWNGLKMMSKPPEFSSDSSSDSNPDQSDVDESDGPMISFVLLQRTQKFLEDRVLARIIEAAWGGNFSTEDENAADGFVVGESPLFVVKSSSGTYMIHNHDQTYWDSIDEVVEQIGELRLRKAVADHQAWLSVDLVAASEENHSPSQQYSEVLKLVLELADEDTLAIFRPETMEINVWSDDLAQRLTQRDAYLMFAEQDNAPVIPISGDNPSMQAAVATAKRRWPEFVSAFQNKSSGDESYNVKARITVGDVSEYIWLDVIGLEPKYVHGRLANDPVDLGELKLGSQVEASIEDIQDWCYIKNSDPIGLFSLEAIRQAQLSQQSKELDGDDGGR